MPTFQEGKEARVKHPESRGWQVRGVSFCHLPVILLDSISLHSEEEWLLDPIHCLPKGQLNMEEGFREGIAMQNWCFRQWSLNEDELSLVFPLVSWTSPAKAERRLRNFSMSSGLPNSGRCFLPWRAISGSCGSHPGGTAAFASFSPTAPRAVILPVTLHAELWEARMSDMIALAQTTTEVASEFWFPSIQVL